MLSSAIRRDEASLKQRWEDAPPMPVRLRPTAPLAPAAILVGDPGRALLLAQELLEAPKMSNHARGLWGYSGRTAAGEALTIQATGMGGPSAAMVLADLAELGVGRAVRIGTCVAFGDARPGDLLIAETALAVGASSASFGVAVGDAATPDPELTRRVTAELGEEGRPVTVASLDAMPAKAETAGGAAAADMQTLAVLAAARRLGIAAAAVLIAAETERDGRLADEQLERAAAQAGAAVARAVSNPQVEG
jgi:purine-nucleoside phosphorylase